MNHKHKALWPLKNYKLYTIRTFILSNYLPLTIGSKLILTQSEFNVVMQILKFFSCVYDSQRIPPIFLLTMYYNTFYTSPFLVKSGSPLVCFHPKLSYLYFSRLKLR
jgi:hypothetical protein